MRVVRARRGIAVALCVTLLGAASSRQAGAQPSAAGATASAGDPREQAKTAYEEGVKAASQGQWERARAAFLKAWGLKQHWQIALNLGQAELKQGKYRDAEEHLAYFLREAEGVSPADRKRGEEMAGEAREHLGEVSITASQAGAEAVVDEVVVGKAPLGKALLVEPGPHVVAVRLEGFVPAQKTIEVGARSSTEVHFELSRFAEAKPAPRIEQDRPVQHREEIAVRDERRDLRPWWIAGGGILTATALGVGVASTLVSNRASEDATREFDDLSYNVAHRLSPSGKNLCGPDSPATHNEACQQINDSLAKQDRFKTIAVTGYAFAGAAAIGTLIFAFVAKRRTEAPGPQIIPVVGTTNSGAMLRTSF